MFVVVKETYMPHANGIRVQEIIAHGLTELMAHRTAAFMNDTTTEPHTLFLCRKEIGNEAQSVGRVRSASVVEAPRT
jgi:hypothetical protein